MLQVLAFFVQKIMRRRFNNGWFFVAPAIVVFLLFKYYPILMGMFISFFDFAIMNPPGVFVGFRNYLRAFSDPVLRNALKNTVQFWGIMIAINFFVPLILAVMVDEVRKYKGLVRTFFYIPAIIPSVVVTVLWKYIWQPDYGLANYFMSVVHLPEQLWLNNVNLVKWCMRFPYTFIMASMGGGMDFIIYLAMLNNISKEMYESSQIEGATFFRRFFRITLPNLMPTMSMLLVMNTIAVFNLFDEVMIMTGGGPARASETLVLYAFQKAYREMDYSYAITITTLSFLIVFLLTVIQMKIKTDTGNE
jgi:multiple sugar transport system permease protein